MRVLWLTSVQLVAATGETSMSGCGWLEGLRASLERHAPDVELTIVSWGAIAHKPMQAGNATYYSLAPKEPGGRVYRARERWRHQFIPESAIVQAAGLVRDLSPDIVHVHGTEHPLGLASLRCGHPTVASLQGIASVCDRAMLKWVPPTEVLRDTATRRFVRGDGYLHDAATMRTRAAAERRILASIKHYTGQTDWDEAVLRVLAPGSVYHRCTRVLQPAFYTAGSLEPPGHPSLFCTSSAAPYKGLEVLLEAFRLILDAHTPEAQLRVAGDLEGTAPWPFLQRLIRRLRLQHHVTFLGRLTAPQLVRELRQTSLFVLPSHIENESNALLEAMLVGVPCVAAATGGVPTVLRDGTDGLLYEDDNPFALAAAVTTLIRDPSRADALAQSGRRRAILLTDPERGAADMCITYKNVLADGAAAVPR